MWPSTGLRHPASHLTMLGKGRGRRVRGQVATFYDSSLAQAKAQVSPDLTKGRTILDASRDRRHNLAKSHQQFCLRDILTKLLKCCDHRVLHDCQCPLTYGLSFLIQKWHCPQNTEFPIIAFCSSWGPKPVNHPLPEWHIWYLHFLWANTGDEKNMAC